MTTMKRSHPWIKRSFDLVVAASASPLILVTAGIISFLIRVTTGPEVIFRQERAGQGMKPFVLYKFRTMAKNVDPFGPSPKEDQDPRLTPIGRWLRKTSLDELPQFWNVLKGDMSLVGPRPLYMEQAKLWDTNQRRRLDVKPGLTGLAQISGRGELTHENKIEMDLRYVDSQSMWLDCKILLATLFKVFRSEGIFEKQYSRDELTRGDSNTL